MSFQLRIAAAAAALACTGIANAGTLTIESWRGDDKATWEQVLIPAFQKANPGITVKFLTTTPNEYNAAVNARFIAGTAGDLIQCRPFDLAETMYKAGNLADIAALPGMKNFPTSAKLAWQTADAKSAWCMPMASVIHGYFYNKKVFAELGLKVPTTEAEFFDVLTKVKAAGKVAPVSLGTADGWETSEIVYTGQGPAYWKGEEGRQGLIKGTKKFSDPEFVAPLKFMEKLADFLPRGYQAQGYGDSQTLFASGKAAIIPTGSWDISFYDKEGKGLEYGAFRPVVPKKGDTCYISDHIDMAMGMNAKTKNKKDAEVFLNWMASAEFAELFGNKTPGFFPLSSAPIKLTNPVAAEMLSWRKDCKPTIRAQVQHLDKGQPSLGAELQVVGQGVINKKLSPEAGGKQLADGIAKWYKPAN
ncbi:MAG: carbohydrate ABC transporter substrate-binding protein [Curvibacter sp.]|nr:MAG: carbohydrate ABC transporter substrate-binding protein [Curvibacter sp.]